MMFRNAACPVLLGRALQDMFISVFERVEQKPFFVAIQAEGIAGVVRKPHSSVPVLWVFRIAHDANELVLALDHTFLQAFAVSVHAAQLLLRHLRDPILP